MHTGSFTRCIGDGGVADLFSLWPHQHTLYTEIESAWSRNIRSVCAQLSTGGGKTRIIRMIVDAHAAAKKVIYVVAHRSTLVRQLSDELTEGGIQHGIIQSGAPYLRYRVQVCSMATLVNRVHKLPEPEVIIIDESHHSLNNSYQKIITAWPTALVLGMTATPERPDGKPLSNIFQHLITGPQPRELIDDGYLCDYDYYAPGDVDMTGAHKRGGDYVQSESLERVDKKQIIGSAVDHYREYADHQPAIASCVSIAHAEHVAEQFRESGYRAVAVHSKMDPRFVQRSINGLRDGSLDVLSQCEMLGEGVDIKGAVALIGLRPTASLVVFLQHVGRVLRISPGKTGAVILDHVGNWERHGLPDDPREWSLEGRVKRETGQAKLKRCPGCLRPVPISTRVCPHCGNQWTETADPGERIPEEAEGKLVSIRDIRRGDRNQLVLEIARKADHLKQAVHIAKDYGVDHRGAWYIWTHELRKKA